MTRLLAALPVRPADPDRELLGRWAGARDEAAFAELLRRHGPLVWGVCRRQLANPADAEDAFQAAFLVLARRADAVTGCVGGFLHRVAVLTCRNVRRANRRRPASALPSDIPVSPPTDRVLVDDLLNRLPERDRRAVVLCHLLGLTRTEAATELGIPEGTLSARLSRGLARLRGKEAALTVAVVPAALLASTARAVGVWEATAVGLSPAATGAATGVLRMYWARKLVAIGVMLAAVVAGGVGLAVTADPSPVQPPKAGGVDKLPPLAGRWAVVDADLGYVAGRAEGIVTLTETAVTAVEVGGRKCMGKFQRAGRRVRFDATDPGGDVTERFEAIQDPATPDRMAGSMWTGSRVERVVFRRLAAGEDPSKPGPPPDLPAARKEWLDLAIKAHHAIASATAPSRKQKPADEQAKIVAAAVEAQTAYTAAEPRLLRKLVADEPNTVHGYDAARELLSLAGRQGGDWSDRLNAELGVKAGTVRAVSQVTVTVEEMRAWGGIVRRYAATCGPQMEAGAMTQAANDASRSPKFLAMAEEWAAEADKLATAAGLPATAGRDVAKLKEEAAVWAAQKNPPAAGSVWTVTVKGRVTDPAGKPIRGAKVVVNNLQNSNLVPDQVFEVTTDAEGRYTAPVRCKGERRLHVTGMWAEAKGFVKRWDRDRHSLLPGESATVNFTLTPGEKFAGVVKLPADEWVRFAGTADGTASVWVRGPAVEEWLVLKNGERFELYLPPGKYAVTMDGFGDAKRSWDGLAAGAAEHALGANRPER